MSTVKCGYGYRDCYGHSKPLIKYHSQEAPASVTTVVAETSGMRVHEKPPYNGAGAMSKKHILMEEVEAGVYSGRHGGNVQKHAFLEENAGVYSDHRGGTVQKHVGSAVPTHQYREQKEESDISEESEDESDCEEEQTAYGQHGTGGVQKHGYGEQKAYQYGDGVGGYGAFHHDSSVENHGYGGQQAYQDVGYGALQHDSTAQKKHAYGGKQAYQDGGYGALHHDSTAQTEHGYGKQGAYEGDVAGHDALIQSRAAQMHAYGGYGVQNTRGLDVHGYKRRKRFLTSYFVIWSPWGKNRW